MRATNQTDEQTGTPLPQMGYPGCAPGRARDVSTTQPARTEATDETRTLLPRARPPRLKMILDGLRHGLPTLLSRDRRSTTSSNTCAPPDRQMPTPLPHMPH